MRSLLKIIKNVAESATLFLYVLAILAERAASRCATIIRRWSQQRSSSLFARLRASSRLRRRRRRRQALGFLRKFDYVARKLARSKKICALSSIREC